jgi:hypothetical protein
MKSFLFLLLWLSTKDMQAREAGASSFDQLHFASAMSRVHPQAVFGPSTDRRVLEALSFILPWIVVVLSFRVSFVTLSSNL